MLVLDRVFKVIYRMRYSLGDYEAEGNSDPKEALQALTGREVIADFVDMIEDDVPREEKWEVEEVLINLDEQRFTPISK